MTDRTNLALAACQGLSDAELAERGTAGYQKMRDRKRHYAKVARTMAGMGKALLDENTALKKRIAQLEATASQMQALDAPVTDTSAAADMLAAISKKGAQ